MKKLFLKLSLAIVAMLLLTNADVLAQNFTNNIGGTYNATCAAVIKLNSADPAQPFFNGTAPLGGPIGNPTTSIPGVVEYAYANGSAGSQTVQQRQYSYLVLSGLGDKTVADGVVVTGDECADFLTGYDDLATYPYYNNATPTYVGTFTYGGDGQNIWPDTYNDVAVTNGLGNVLLGDLVTVVSITTDGTSPLDIDGTLTLGTGTSTFASNVDVSGTINGDAGTSDFTANTDIDGVGAAINVGDGPMNFNTIDITQGTLNAPADAGDVTFNGNAAIGISGDIVFGDNTILTVGAGFTNAGDGTNLDFSCLSEVIYTAGATLVMPTLELFPYGNLTLQGGDKGVETTVSTYTPDINLCADFDLSGGNLNMLSSNGAFRMNTPTATADYAANEEVIGAFNREVDGDARSYTFNNAQTIATFVADGNNPERFQFDVRPSTAPDNYVADSDVNRKISVSYTGNLDDFAMTLRAGFLDAERPDLGWATPYTQASLRFYEAYGAPGVEKVSNTGNLYNRNAAPVTGATLGFVELAGIQSTSNTTFENGLDLFASGYDLLLRAGPTPFYTIASGRWTNPNVWDEGTIPTSVDDAYLRHSIYVGIDAPFIDTFYDSGLGDNNAVNNTLDEFTHYGGNLAAANTIEIMANGPLGTDRPALIIGNEDNPASYVFSTAANGVSFSNLNTNAPAYAWSNTPNHDKVADLQTADLFNGLWVIGLGAGIPAFGTNQISNQGTINNEGIIEVGN